MGRSPDPRPRPGLLGRVLLRMRSLALASARRRAIGTRRELEALVAGAEGPEDAAR